MQNPKPFRSTSRENAKPLFVIRGYSLEAARAIAATMIAGETVVVAIKLSADDFSRGAGR